MENRPWLANYPSGVPANINVDEFDSLVDFAEDCFKKHRSKFVFELILLAAPLIPKLTLSVKKKISLIKKT